MSQVESQTTIIRTARIVQAAAKDAPEFMEWLLNGLRADIASVDEKWYHEAANMDEVNQWRGQKSAFIKILGKINDALNRDLAVETKKLEVFQQAGGQK